MVRRQNEGSFGCEAVARAFGQPNVPECAVGFHFLCPYAAKILFSFCRLFCLFTMNANVCVYAICRLFFRSGCVYVICRLFHL